MLSKFAIRQIFVRLPDDFVETSSTTDLEEKGSVYSPSTSPSTDSTLSSVSILSELSNAPSIESVDPEEEVEVSVKRPVRESQASKVGQSRVLQRFRQIDLILPQTALLIVVITESSFVCKIDQ